MREDGLTKGNNSSTMRFSLVFYQCSVSEKMKQPIPRKTSLLANETTQPPPSSTSACVEHGFAKIRLNSFCSIAKKIVFWSRTRLSRL